MPSAGGGGTTNHAALNNLGFAAAAHTAFAGNPLTANLDLATFQLLFNSINRSIDYSAPEFRFLIPSGDKFFFRGGNLVDFFQVRKSDNSVVLAVNTLNRRLGVNTGTPVTDFEVRDSGGSPGGTATLGNTLPDSSNTRDHGSAVLGWRDGFYTRTLKSGSSISASAPAVAALDIPVFTANPTTLVDGDVWLTDIAGVRKINARIGGVTYSATLT